MVIPVPNFNSLKSLFAKTYSPNVFTLLGMVNDVAFFEFSNALFPKVWTPSSNVNVLVAHGFARQLVATTVSYTDTTAEDYYNIKLTGNVKFDTYTGKVNVYDAFKDKTETIDELYHGASMLNDTDRMYIRCDATKLYIQVSADINATIMLNGYDADSIRTNQFGGYKVIAD